MPKKRILILAANPKASPYLDLPSEVEKIKEALERAHLDDKFEIIDRACVTPEKLSWTVLKVKPDIVHFCGHGYGDEGLLLEGATDQGQLVSTKALSGLFELFADKVECVLLNACYAEVQADVIKQHIKYVVGMSEAIGDKAAIKFSVGFYDALYDGQDYEFAFKYACNRICLDGIDQALLNDDYPEEYLLLAERGFKATRILDASKRIKIYSNVAVLDLVNYKLVSDSERGSLKEEEIGKLVEKRVSEKIKDILNALPNKAVLVVYIRPGKQRINAIDELSQKVKYYASANTPVNLMGTIVDSAYVADAWNKC